MFDENLISSKFFKLAVFFMAFVGSFFVFYWQIVFPEMSMLNDLKKQELTLKLKFQSHYECILNINQNKSQIDIMEIELKNKFLLNNNEEISNKINSIANSSSMNVEDFHVLDNLQTEKNKRFFLRLNGNYANFVLFLKHFSQVYKILKIDRISRVSQEVEINFRSIL